MTGTTISHYRIGDLLGAGGMGEVYRAEDTRLGRSVALKFLKRGQDEPVERARMLREARAASALRSSNIAAIYDLGEHDDRPFIVMELVDGEPLSTAVSRGPLPIRDAVSIAMQAADALDEAHAHGIVHRDIKSSNLILDGRGRVKLLDFGLAKLTAAASADTETGLLETKAGTVLGTFAYMSPEQVRGQPLDHRTDLFSLGVVLYETLTGRLPFEGRTVTEVADAILHDEPAGIGRFNYAVPADLERIVRKALTKDPMFRYQSARELYIDLHTLGRTLDPNDVSARTGRTAAAKSSPGQAAMPAETCEHTVAVMTFSNITREPADEWIGSGIAETVTADLQKVKGIHVLGRAQVYDAIKHLSGQDLARVQEGLAIDIGRRLGANWIVGGGYQRLGNNIRITVECVDVRSGQLARTLKIDGTVDDLFALQDRIVYELTEGLKVALRQSEIEAIGKHETESLEAYAVFSRGLMNLRLATPESLDRALALFEQAIGLDPSYATAWALLGMTYNLKAQFLSLPNMLSKAVDALERSIALDARNVYGHTGLGAAYLAQQRYDDAIVLLRKAIELDPKNVLARSSLARALWIGKGDIAAAIAELDEAVRINVDAGYAHLQLSLLYTILGKLDRAEEEARRTVALQDSLQSGHDGLQLVGGHVRLGYVFYRQGRYDQALEEYTRERDFLTAHDHALRERLVIELAQKVSAVWWRRGDRVRADEHFDEAVRAFRARESRGADDPFTRYYMGALYALRGDALEASRHLAASMRVHAGLARVRVLSDPDFDPVRDSPEIQALMTSVANRVGVGEGGNAAEELPSPTRPV